MYLLPLNALLSATFAQGPGRDSATFTQKRTGSRPLAIALPRRQPLHGYHKGGIMKTTHAVVMGVVRL